MFVNAIPLCQSPAFHRVQFPAQILLHIHPARKFRKPPPNPHPACLGRVDEKLVDPVQLPVEFQS